MQLSCECIACLNQFVSRLTSSMSGYTTLHHICQQIGGKRAAGTMPSDLLYMYRAQWDASKMQTTQPPNATECSSAGVKASFNRQLLHHSMMTLHASRCSNSCSGTVSGARHRVQPVHFVAHTPSVEHQPSNRMVGVAYSVAVQTWSMVRGTIVLMQNPKAGC